MDQKDQKPADVSSDPDVEKPLDEADLDVVTGGLTSVGGVGGGSDPGCITYSP